jgi:hypothetical protein
MTMVFDSACGVPLSAWSSRPIPPIPERAMSTSDELQYIHDTDQSDRFSRYPAIDPGRDQIRLQRVKALYHAGKIMDPRINTTPRWFVNTEPVRTTFSMLMNWPQRQPATGYRLPPEYRYRLSLR